MAETLAPGTHPSLKSWPAPTPFTVAPADGRSAAPASFPSCSAKPGAESIAPCGRGCAAYPAARRWPDCWPSGAPSAIKADCRRCVGEASSPGPTPTTRAPAPGRPSASGAVADAPGETWRAVDAALRVGVRGLPGGIVPGPAPGPATGPAQPPTPAPADGGTGPRLGRRPPPTHGRLAHWPRPARSPTRREKRGRPSAAPFISAAEAFPAARRWAGFWPNAAAFASRAGCPRSPCDRFAPGRRPTAAAPGAWPTPATGPVLEAPGRDVAGIQFGPVRRPPRSSRRSNARRPAEPATAGRRRPGSLPADDRADPRLGRRPPPAHGRLASLPIRPHPRRRGETWRTVDSALRRNRRGWRAGGRWFDCWPRGEAGGPSRTSPG